MASIAVQALPSRITPRGPESLRKEITLHTPSMLIAASAIIARTHSQISDRRDG